MSTSGTSVPVLVAAFLFGIVVNAASAALLLHVSSHRGTVFRDGQRLVLTTFLLGATLWAQTDFISILINTTAASSCQVGIIFSTLFDQLARVSIEQYLLWAINKGAKSGVQQMALQALIVSRFVVGCVFVAFSRPQFNPACVPMSSMMPVAVVVVVLDFVLIAALAIIAVTAGLLRDARGGSADAGPSKAILLVIVAFAIWTGTSVVMLLGMTSADFRLRTLLPATGLSILVFIITTCNGALTTSSTKSTRAPDSPGIRNITTGSSVSTDASSDYPPSRFEDVKRSEIMTTYAFEQPREAPGVPPVPANFSRPVVMLANVEAPPLMVQNETFAPSVSAFATAAVSGLRKVDIRPQGKTKRSLLDLKGGPGAGRGGKMTISNPILEANGDQNPLNKIATISLEEAARGERERRANDLQRESALIAKRPAPQPPNMSTEEAMKRSVSLRRKEVAPVSSQPPIPTMSNLEPMPMGTTSSAQLSPGVEELRRRSPRQPPVDSEADQSMRTMPAAMPSAPSPTIPLPSPRQEVPRQLDGIDNYDQPEQVNVTLEQNQETTDFIIQPATFAPPARPARQDADLPAPPIGADASIRRPEIRPSRQLPKTPTQPASEAPQPPLLRRPTNGLPRNPRATAMQTLDNGQGAGRQQTVMFMNNIVYDNPERVQDIINDASNKETKRRSTHSIVHRPRPIPRHLEKDRAIFPAEPSPNLAGHRRSKSGGSIVSRKSIILSNPGSPTQLPPLPLPPKNTGYSMAHRNADRPQPNDTKSMTFDEKMTLLFPTPPSGEPLARRRSSVPEMPAMPLDYMPIILSPTEGYDRDSRMSQSTIRTGRTSIKTENILEVNELPRRADNISHLSGGRNQSMNEDVSSTWLPSLAGSSRAANLPTGGRKRASSPVLPPTRDSTTTMSTDVRTHDDATTNWGSVHSPVVAVPIPANRQVARTTYINGGERGDGLTLGPAGSAPNDNSEPLLPLLPATTYNGGKTKASPTSSDQDSAPWQKKSEKRESQWHRRVGDDTLSFSDRKEGGRSRKMPPPTPLLLNPSSTKNPVVVKAAEPSPLESPERALAYIQEQLRRYEEPNLAVAEETPTRRLALLDNLEREMDMQAGHWQEMQHDLRHDSLSSMQTLSPSTESRRQSVISSHNAAVVPQRQQQQHAKESVALHIGADRRAARRSRIQASSWNRVTAEESVVSSIPAPAARSLQSGASKRGPFSNTVLDLGALGSPTPPDSDEEDLDLRLHRPYDTLEAAISASVDGALTQKTARGQKPTLWIPAAKSAAMTMTTTTTTTLLWTPAPAVPSHQPTVMFASITSTMQPLHSSGRTSKTGKQQLSGPLPIESLSLWTKRSTQPSQPVHSSRGLWMSHSQPEPVQQDNVAALELTEEELMMQKMKDLELEMDAMEADREERVESSQKAPRPVTQRPPRRNKRVTLLPDILESPKPLPDKRGTLGIFQFPWGERSDTAKPPTPPFRGAPFGAMPGTMASGGGKLNAALEARAKELEANEYSSSFFDDYDDDEDFDDEDNGFGEDGSGSDDGFDETTLWEIASLLKTEQVPSTLSMFPPPLSSGSVMGDYIDDIQSGHEVEHLNEMDSRNYADVVEVVAGLNPQSRRRDSQLWNDRQDVTTASTNEFSMAQPDKETWKSYDTVSQAATLRSKPRKSESSTIETGQLWDRSTIKTLPANPRSSLWTATKQKKMENEKAASQAKAAQLEIPQLEKPMSTKLWAPKPVPEVSAKGPLFDRDVAAVEKMNEPTRMTDKTPAALDMPRTPRKLSSAPLEKLMSTNLWTTANGGASRMWAPMPVPNVLAKGPLFDRDAAAAQKLHRPIRTTALEPAAVDMVRAPRSLSHLPQLRLESTKLWSAAETSTHHVRKPTENNWILAKDPKTLPVVVDDTIPASSVGVKQKTWWEKMKAAAGVSSAASASPAASLASVEKEIDQVRMAPPAPQQQQHRVRPAASHSDWEAALQEAVTASYPWLQRRISATPNQWQAALDHAVARSYPFDAARQHPVLAGGPSVPATLSNDASKVHPVFFRSVDRPNDAVVQLVQSRAVAAALSRSEATYGAQAVALENQAATRPHAPESGSRGVVLRF
ncbi:hypothetical protein HMPREF1624_02349 [Sporothrix schenckii ATCC 58251]|uniref:Uncharacterized protein n=1 Tax=Sporothrix schenckii (strain ATCC 58251 / de Perez 2211183) TaxID=1391915 RepID=U7Q275_SPOS1|nr:hypothetical protein HMPREF1624_02349 [Sporothrix schenckii ATCC 58251]